MRRTELDPTSSPVAAFGVQLRRSREAKNLTQVAMAELIGYSDTLVSSIERATRNPTQAFAIRADNVLDTGGTLELMYWNIGHTSLLEGFPEYAAQEAKAVEIRHFELGVVPGLLQTPDYAAAFASAAVRRGNISQVQADDRLRFLLTRQKLLDRSPAPWLHFVLDEGCLRRPVGGIKVMRRQLRQLEELAARPHITIQVAPYSLAEELPFTMMVTLLTMADRSLLAYSESQLRGFLVRRSETARALERDYHQLSVEALPKVASLEMIRQA
ncbi:helix-turn-helix transcriptional regulator [Streptomyces sp. BE20]|uniref:helix-turn-helix domain-containing protein n=1 Tax=unclassified Streptomyces TaxID=2593676 RepID=UPI002E796CB9|nr:MULTISPECIES: helix-turn-helix transcriptional regulator [unclassified Streptomyces]MED7948881.1 helix-turn-helix transcriptional regulator [Streptomyces sp. BE303]MEE1823287.1 helix-turn-helix transcriptional regulator [Streptomyces sp. BE20]